MPAANNYVSIPSLDQEGVDVDKLDLKQNIEASIERGFNTAPASADMAGKKGRPYAVNDAEIGPAIDQPIDLGGQPIAGYLANSPDAGDITAASFTFDSTNAAVYTGRRITLNRATAQTITFDSSLPDGFIISWYVKGTGQSTFAAGAGLTLRPSVAGHSKSANQYARGGVELIGTDLSLFGNTAA